jgi:hypothetical protein
MGMMMSPVFYRASWCRINYFGEEAVAAAAAVDGHDDIVGVLPCQLVPHKLFPSQTLTAVLRVLVLHKFFSVAALNDSSSISCQLDLHELIQSQTLTAVLRAP